MRVLLALLALLAAGAGVLAAPAAHPPAPAAAPKPATPAAQAAVTPKASGAALLAAVRQGQHDAAVALLAGRADPNARTPDHTSTLMWAVHNDDADLVERLIRAGARAADENDYGASPMSEAAEVADARIIAALLKRGASANTGNPEGETALMSVARTSHVDAAELLLANGALVDAAESWRGQTALMWAAAQGQPEMVKLLIKNGADVNARSIIRHWKRRVTAEPRPQNRPVGGLTPLLFAAREGCVGCVRAMIAAHADLNLSDPDSITPLLMAVLNGRFDVAAVLIKAGADVNRWDTWGRAPLYSAVDYNTTPRGGRPDRPSSDRTTALELEELLLSAGANPNMQLKLFPPYRSLGEDRGGDSMLTTGSTPLLRAAKAGDAPSVQLLLAQGARVDLPNSLGITPLMATAGVGSTTVDTRARFRNEDQCIDTARLLVKAGADVNATRDNGQTALHGAALWGLNGMVRFLAQSGANLQAADHDGVRALDVALGRGGPTGRVGIASAEAHKDTAALLESLTAANK
jgi:ankyrin repeat protein